MDKLEKLGIVNVMHIISLIAIMGNIGGKSMVNNKIGMEDLALLPELGTAFPILISTDFSQVFPEIADLSEVERAMLISHFKEKFDIPQDSVEVKAEEILDIVQLQFAVIAKAIKLFSKDPQVAYG